MSWGQAARISLFSGGGSCCGTAGGASELNGADNGFLGRYEFQTFEVEFANLKGLAQAEVVYVDDQTLGNVGIESLDFQFLHREGELAAGFNAFGVAFDLHGHGHNHGLLVGDFEKVDVEDIVLYRVELHLAEHGHLLAAVVGELNCEDVGGIDEFAYGFVGYGEVGGYDAAAVFDFNDFFAGLKCAFVGELERLAAVENHGNFAFVAEGLCGFLAQFYAGLGCKLVSFHVAVK